jgi:uncharacterized ferritin-like protein (DUF455 family)
MMDSNLYVRARQLLLISDQEEKCQGSFDLFEDWQQERLSLEVRELPPLEEAGWPARLEKVPPRRLSKRGSHSQEARGALIHALAHIEFSAINLALDAVWRFRQMPAAFAGDWLQVAYEEAIHFRLLRDRLHAHGLTYGDFPVHLSLWETAVKTANDPLLRMALIPRALEARGLDVTPGMMARFRSAGDVETVAALERILQDEVGHVAAGSRWFHYLCEERGLEPESTYFALLDEHFSAAVRCPLHREARLQAGFSESELIQLKARC